MSPRRPAASAQASRRHAGRDERLEAMVTAHGRRLVGVMRSRGLASEAEAVVGSAFVVAWRHPDRVPASNEFGWLLAVAQNLARNELRARRRREALRNRLALELGDAPISPPPGAEGSFSDMDALRRALDTLTAIETQILEGVAAGLSRSELASLTGLSPAQVSDTLYRARRRAKVLLAQNAVVEGHHQDLPSGGR